jgi:hypothetical protein
VLCIYHDDADGWMSAAIVRRAYPECIFDRFNYGMKVPDLGEHQTIFIIDVCLPFDIMIKLNNERELIWIDHHEPKIIEADKLGFDPIGLRRVGIGACVLTWEYLFPNEECPDSVRFIGRYDVKDIDDDVLNFKFGLDSVSSVNDFTGWLWRMLPCSSKYNPGMMETLFKRGEIARQYAKNMSESYCRSYAYPAILHGPYGRTYNAIVLNLGKASSFAFDSMWDGIKYDVMVSYVQRADKYFISLYTTRDDIDCSEIARYYGGNGHRAASGFCVRDLGIAIELIKRECE